MRRTRAQRSATRLLVALAVPVLASAATAGASESEVMRATAASEYRGPRDADAPAADSRVPEALIGGIESGRGKAGWHGLEIGMTVAEARELLGGRWRPGRDDLFGWSVRAQWRGFEITLATTGEGEDARVTSLTVSMASSVDVRAMSRELRRRFPDARYRASRHDPEVEEEANPSPGYVWCDGREVYVLLKPGLVWLQTGKACENGRPSS